MRHETTKLFAATVATALVSAFIAMLLAIGVCALFVSCSSVKYVPVESVKHDSIYVAMNRRDSIYLRDSVYIRERGDTVFQYRYKYLFVDKAVHDTLYVMQVDSVQVPYPVEKPLTRWQRFRMDVGGWTSTALVILILAAGGMFVKRKFFSGG